MRYMIIDIVFWNHNILHHDYVLLFSNSYLYMWNKVFDNSFFKITNIMVICLYCMILLLWNHKHGILYVLYDIVYVKSQTLWYSVWIVWYSVCEITNMIIICLYWMILWNNKHYHNVILLYDVVFVKSQTWL